MLKIATHEYQLSARDNPTTVRVGALLKVTWPDGKTGYADLHPWPELGDAPLSEHLQGLRKGHFSFLVEQCLWMAKRDAVARIEKKSLLAGLPKIKNHFLIQNPLVTTDANLQSIRGEGFSTVKVKLGKDLDGELAWLNKFMRQHPFTVRIDFGSRLTPQEFAHFCSQLVDSFHKRIEFVEDPFAFADGVEWEKANQLLPLALDFEFDRAVGLRHNPLTPPFKYLIIKPARQDVKKMSDFAAKYRLKMVVTSSLDHPVGNLHAAAVAGELKKFNPNTVVDCGTLTHRAYQMTAFTNEIKAQGPFLLTVAGQGIGFDKLFEGINWTNL